MSRPVSHLALVGAAVAVVILTEMSARAADPAEVERLIQEGIRLRREGSDSRALPLFQRAHDLARTPRTAAQLGLVEFALGYSIDAEAHLLQGLAASSDHWISTNRALLEETLGRVRATIGEIAVTGSPNGAEVLLNGRVVGRLPLTTPLRSHQGPITVELRAPGYARDSKVIDMEGGKRASVDLRLNRESNLAAPSTTGPGASLVERSNAQPAPTSAGTSSSARTVIGWSLLGAGIATAGVGGVLLFTAKDCAPMPGFECTHQAPSRVPGWTLLASGLAASAAGAIVLVTRPTSQTEIAVGLAGVFVRGTL